MLMLQYKMVLHPEKKKRAIEWKTPLAKGKHIFHDLFFCTQAAILAGAAQA